MPIQSALQAFMSTIAKWSALTATTHFWPNRRSWFAFFNNPVFRPKIQSGTLFAQAESNGDMLCALKAHPTSPEGNVRCQIGSQIELKVGASVLEPTSQRAPLGLSDLFCIINQQVCQQLCLSHGPPVSIILPKSHRKPHRKQGMVCPPYRAQPPSRRVVHSVTESLKFISLYVSPRSNE